MWTPVTLNDGSTAPWGYGWQVDDLIVQSTGQAHRHVYHGGDLPGFKAELHRFPDEGLTIIVLLNSDDADSIGIVVNVAVRFYLERE
jgi:hypothetical protein